MAGERSLMRVAQAVVVGGLWAAGLERLKRARAARALAEEQLADTLAELDRLQEQLKRRDESSCGGGS